MTSKRLSHIAAAEIRTIEFQSKTYWKIKSILCERCVFVVPTGHCIADPNLPWQTCGHEAWTDDLHTALKERLS